MGGAGGGLLCLSLKKSMHLYLSSFTSFVSNLPWGGLPRNSVDRITDRPDMTSAVDRGCKASTQTKQNKISFVKKHLFI